jgi:hypothetical protein
MSDDLEDFDDIPLPPDPEFDRDAEFALAIPGLSDEQRERIISQARNLAASGLAREVLGNWICREVARTVGGPVGFEAYDEHGNIIVDPHVAAVRKEITSWAGRKRQIARNANLEPWRQRCKELVAQGLSESDAFHRALAAIHAMRRKAAGEAVAIPHGFHGLPTLYGRDGKSPPKDKKRLRARLFEARLFD